MTYDKSNFYFQPWTNAKALYAQVKQAEDIVTYLLKEIEKAANRHDVQAYEAIFDDMEFFKGIVYGISVGVPRIRKTYASKYAATAMQGIERMYNAANEMTKEWPEYAEYWR